MVWLSSACSVGARVAAILAGQAGVIVPAPGTRAGQVRAKIIDLLGRDPGSKLIVRPDDPAFPVTATDGCGIREVWQLAQGARSGGAPADCCAALAERLDVPLRRFHLDPVVEAPGEAAPGAFAALMQALHATVEEVRSRDRQYFQRKALRTTLPGYRFLNTLAWGHILYIDDLVAVGSHYKRGLGTTLLKYLQDQARACGCAAIHLDTGYQRHLAHLAYLRNGFQFNCHHLAWLVAGVQEVKR